MLVAPALWSFYCTSARAEEVWYTAPFLLLAAGPHLVPTRCIEPEFDLEFRLRPLLFTLARAALVCSITASQLSGYFNMAIYDSGSKQVEVQSKVEQYEIGPQHDFNRVEAKYMGTADDQLEMHVSDVNGKRKV